MTTPDDLLFAYRWGVDSFARFAADIPCERFAERPGEMNPPAWLFVHVGNYHGVIIALLRGEPFDDPWDLPCGKNSTPSDDRGDYPTKEELLGDFQRGFEAAAAVIAEAPAEAWAAPMSHPTWGKAFPSVGAAVNFLATTHLALHLGQLSGWRRAVGLPRV